jgi:multiple sugar transport system permease protein
VLFLAYIGTIAVPWQAYMVPQYIMMQNLGLTNSFNALILLQAFGAFGVFLMRQYIKGLPRDLLDAGRVDGAGELRIFWRIILPLCGPALATLGILTFLASWNNFLWPLVVAQTEDTYTLPVALALFSKGQNATNYGLLLAGATVVVMPILLIFLAFQRRFIEGIATTGIK